jgi:hypothetical protein
MKTQDTDTAGTPAVPPSPARSKRKGWLASIGAIIVVVLVVGLSALVFAQLRQHQANQSTTSTPPSGQWKQVLQGYTFTSIVAARSNPSVLYACAMQVSVTSQASPGSATVLRSTDFGDHWQDLGSKASTGNTCQLAVNPADSNEIYVVGTTGTPQFSTVLKHSTDGGQTWETIQPVLHVPGIHAQAIWFIQQLQLEGNHLFGLQWILPRAYINQPIKAVPYLLPRLVTSTDGGHNWTVIDGQFAAQKLGVHSYAVDPADSNTIYALFGGILLPIEVAVPNDILPSFSFKQELFKTTDGGATWHLLLNNIPFGSQVQLASGNPGIIYVGGTLGPLPLLRGEAEPAFPIPVGSFHLQVSKDGGASWQLVAMPSDMLSVQNWYVSPGGQVYASPTIPFNGQPTAVAGTAVAVTAVPLPTRNPQNAELPPQQNSSPGVHASGAPVALSQIIRRYDPASNSWSDVTSPPATGFTLQVTPAQANSGAILWFIGMVDGRESLYRYVV